MSFTFERGTGATFVVPPQDVYTLVFDGIIEERYHENRENPEGPRDKSYYMRFFIDEPEDQDWHNTEIRAWFPARFTPGNKTGKLFAAMFGGELPDEFEGGMDDLVGKRFRATIGQNDKGYVTVTSPMPVRVRRPKAEVNPLLGEPPF